MCFQCLFCLLKTRSIEVFRQTEEIKWIHCRLKRVTWWAWNVAGCRSRNVLRLAMADAVASRWKPNTFPFAPLLLFNTLTLFLLYFFLFLMFTTHKQPALPSCSRSSFMSSSPAFSNASNKIKPSRPNPHQLVLSAVCVFMPHFGEDLSHKLLLCWKVQLEHRLRRVRPPVDRHGSTREALNRFSWNLVLGISNGLWPFPVVVEVRQN